MKKSTLLMLALLGFGLPTQAATINTNDVKITVGDDGDSVQKKWEGNNEDCNNVEIGNVKLSSDGCGDHDDDHKDKENRSVHGDNNPGKGNKKNKH